MIVVEQTRPARRPLGVTWWGHSFVTVDLPGATVVTDPLMAQRLFHLRRLSPPPPGEATRCDLVLISHLHHDHLHLPTLRRLAADVPIVVPRGAPGAIRALRRLPIIEVEPGDQVTVAGVGIEVLAANHPGGRLRGSGPGSPPAIGFRFSCGGRSCWYPGDTGPGGPVSFDPVDLAIVPIGGWGPSLGAHHLDPAQAVDALAEAGARWALPVHYGTFWPLPMRTGTRSFDHWFATPGQRLRAAAETAGLRAELVIPDVGERVSLG